MTSRSEMMRSMRNHDEDRVRTVIADLLKASHRVQCDPAFEWRATRYETTVGETHATVTAFQGGFAAHVHAGSRCISLEPVFSSAHEAMEAAVKAATQVEFMRVSELAIAGKERCELCGEMAELRDVRTLTVCADKACVRCAGEMERENELNEGVGY